MSPWCDICGSVAGYGLVNVACYHVTCHTSDTLTSNRTRSPPQVNDALTPRACQALLAYTFTLGEPVRCIPLFLQCLRGWSVRYRALYSRSCIGYVTGIFYRMGLVLIYFCTLYSPNALLAFRVPDQSQCTQTSQAWAK